MSSGSHPNAIASGRSKSVLFCPACGHESPVAGDWDVHRRSGRDALTCPECHATVTTGDRVADPIA